MDHVAELWIGGREGPANDLASDGAAFTGFAVYKYILDKEHMAGKQDQWPYLRLPEIYLSYAEALNEVGRTSDAYQYVNYVRTRVRLPGLKSGLTQDEMRKEILDERAREFGVEEVRYYDMIRWKQYYTEFVSAVEIIVLILMRNFLLRRDLFRTVRMEPFSSLRNGICLPSHL